MIAATTTKRDAFKPGVFVRLRKGIVTNNRAAKRNKIAKIHALLEYIEGGVYLDRELEGLKYWNVSDLEVIEAHIIKDNKGRYTKKNE